MCAHVYVHVHSCTYVRPYDYVMSQLSDWKEAHMCTDNHMCLGGSQLREGANAGQHTAILSLPLTSLPQRRGLLRERHHYFCEHVGLDTNQGLHHVPERNVLG